MLVTDLGILLEVSHATHFHTKKEQYVFRQIYIFPGDGPSAYPRLYRWYTAGAYFVIRAKSNTKLREATIIIIMLMPMLISEPLVGSVNPILLPKKPIKKFIR